MKKSKITILFALFIAHFFIACTSDDDNQFIKETLTLDGFWFSEEKGYVLNVSGEKNTVYNTSVAGCSLFENDLDLQENALILEQTSENTLIVKSKLSTFSQMNFVRLNDQNMKCLPDQIMSTNDPKINFDHFWNIFNDYYAFFELRNVNWSEYKGLRDNVTSDNFYETLEELALLFLDSHVSISDEAIDINIQSGTLSLLERLNTNLSGDFSIETEDDFDELLEQKKRVIIEKYLEGAYEINENGSIAWGVTNKNIAYINILGMSGFGTNASDEIASLNTLLDEIMNTIKKTNVSKLIIDIRFNGGGLDQVSLEIASRFTDKTRIAFSKKARLGNGFTNEQVVSFGPKGNYQFTGDIILLTSPMTASAAEIFTLCMKDMTYVTIVGENTNGVFSDILSHKLPNGAEIGLSNEVYKDASGSVFEAIGIGPDNEENQIPFFLNIDFIDKKDSGIDRAIELLN